MLNVPEWLQTLVATEKFHADCPIPHAHTGGYKTNPMTYFCVSCNVGPFCETEKAQNHDPSRDTVLRVWKQGEFSLIRAKDLGKLLNLDNIKQYVGHEGLNVVHIRARLEGGTDARLQWFCVFCGRRLFDKFRFCSLACKMSSIMDKPNSPDTLMPKASNSNFLGGAGTCRVD